MLQELERVSDALREAGRSGRLDGSLMPAMFGCPECRTAWVIASPAPLGACADCGVAFVVLTAAQAAACLKP